jgi:hypothetical protein
MHAPPDVGRQMISDEIFTDPVDRMRYESLSAADWTVTGGNGGSHSHAAPQIAGWPGVRPASRRELLSRAFPAPRPSTLSAWERIRSTKTAEWMLGYVAMASLLLQLVDIVWHLWTWPVVVERAISLALGLGLLPALVLTWYHGEAGRQRVCATEALLLVSLVTMSAFVVWSLCFAR